MLEESRAVLTSLTVLDITDITMYPILLLERKAGRKHFNIQFCLITYRILTQINAEDLRTISTHKIGVFQSLLLSPSLRTMTS